MHTEHFLECRFSACTHLRVREILGWAWSLVRGMQKAQSQCKHPSLADRHESDPKALRKSDWGLISTQNDISSPGFGPGKIEQFGEFQNNCSGMWPSSVEAMGKEHQTGKWVPQHQQTDSPLFLFSTDVGGSKWWDCYWFFNYSPCFVTSAIW